MEVIQFAPHRKRRALFNRLADLLGRGSGRFADYIEDETMSEGKRLFTTAEVAELLVVNPETVRRWIRTGELAAQTVARSHRVERAELERFWRARGGGKLFADSEGGDE